MKGINQVWILYLKIEHLESAHVERYPNETHTGSLYVYHVLVKGLDVVVVDGYSARLVQKWEGVSVTGAVEYRVEATTRAVNEFHLVLAGDAEDVGFLGHVRRVFSIDCFFGVVTEDHVLGNGRDVKGQVET
jgi:hypothetical protein